MRLESWPLLLVALALVIVAAAIAPRGDGGPADRACCGKQMARIAGPVLEAAAAGRLRASLPSPPFEKERARFAASEALCRTLAGLAPWLELDPDDSREGQLRSRLRDQAV